MAPWERGGRTSSTLPWSLLRAAALTASPLDRGRLRSSPVLPRREGRWAWEEEGEDGDGGRLLLFRGGPVPSGAQLLMKQWRGAFRREAPTRPRRRRGVQGRSLRRISPSCVLQQTDLGLAVYDKIIPKLVSPADWTDVGGAAPRRAVTLVALTASAVAREALLPGLPPARPLQVVVAELPRRTGLALPDRVLPAGGLGAPPDAWGSGGGGGPRDDPAPPPGPLGALPGLAAGDAGAALLHLHRTAGGAGAACTQYKERYIHLFSSR